MPKLWNATIEEHRHEVRDAVFTATTSLLRDAGLRGLTMSRIAAQAGIGRATLYKYFADVDSILLDWHQEQVSAHLHRLAGIARGDGAAADRLAGVLTAFLHMARGADQHSGVAEIAASLHGPQRMSEPEAALRDLLTDLLREAALDGTVRDDVPADELAAYCLQAMTAARHAKSQAALSRLQQLVLSGLAPN